MSASPALFVDSSLDPPDELVNNRADLDDRAVLEDWYLDRGIRVTRLGCALFFIHDADAANAANAAERDRILTISADLALEVLIELKSPGTAWLDLCEPAERSSS